MNVKLVNHINISKSGIINILHIYWTELIYGERKLAHVQCSLATNPKALLKEHLNSI